MANFRDLLPSQEEIATRLKDGANDKNLVTAHKYIESIIRIRGLEAGVDENIEIVFPGLDSFKIDRDTDWENYIDVTKPDEGRHMIDGLLGIEGENQEDE